MGEHNKYMTEQLQFCGNKALNSTCQLFHKANVIGSGVFICVNDKKYLVSAAHVLEPEFIEKMTIPNGELLIEINGILHVTQLPTFGSRNDDKIDLAIVQLTDECITEIEKRFRFIPLNEIDVNHAELKSHQYLFCGYPKEMTIVKHMEMIIKPTPLKVRTKITKKELLITPDYSHGSKWILDYNQNNQVNVATDKMQYSPHPKGVSGAGLWSIPFKPNVPIENTDMKLVGIMTDFFEAEDKVVCATNIKLVIDIIKKINEDSN